MASLMIAPADLDHDRQDVGGAAAHVVGADLGRECRVEAERGTADHDGGRVAGTLQLLPHGSDL
jgi:hypothetical protein